jgi:hypothetical protein
VHWFGELRIWQSLPRTADVRWLDPYFYCSIKKFHVTDQSEIDNFETFVGFWPARENCGEVADFELENRVPTTKTTQQLRATLLSYQGAGWKMIICADYLCLLHLDEYEPGLAAERKPQDIRSPTLLRATSIAWPRYVEALNAWYFVLFAACRTARNWAVLNDFAELSFWNCSRILYDQEGRPVRHANYGRTLGAYLRRFQLQLFDSPPTFMSLDHGIFDDASHYWDTIYSSNLVPLAALGCKIVSEHRLGNYRPAIALAWFELEAWVNEQVTSLGYPSKTARGKDRRISDMLDDFPRGTSVANLRDDLHTLRAIRNDIAHNNAAAAHSDSALALKCFVKMLNARSGLPLEVDDLPPPTIGL